MIISNEMNSFQMKNWLKDLLFVDFFSGFLSIGILITPIFIHQKDNL
jgi:hypothetical protein